MTIKRGTEIPTIDVNLVTIKVEGATDEIALDTASKIAVTPQVDTQEATKLVIKGVLKAQKPEQTTITGNEITLTDNVFTPELVKAMQGGTITYDTTDPTKVIKYQPPTVGSGEKGSIFTLNAYSAIYDTSGTITGYEKISYPNCHGNPVAMGSEDNVFRVSEYTIVSAPKKDESPYIIEYVDALPVVS